jgi:hypothetical protein
MLGQTDAKELYNLWERVTNRMGSEDMTPHLVEALNREHPTLRQQMVAMMVSLLNSLDTKHGCDARCEASCAFVSHFQEWLEQLSEKNPYNQQYFAMMDGKVRFPFI